MRRLPIGTLLLATNLGLLLLAVAGIALVAASLLGRLADQQARAQVAQRASADAAGLKARAADLTVAARLLAERPSIQRLIEEDDVAGLTTLLEQFCSAGGLLGCAALANGQPVVSVGDDLPWAALAQTAEDGAALYQAEAGAPIAAVAAATTPRSLALTVVVAQPLVGDSPDRSSAVLTAADVAASSAEPADLRRAALAGAPQVALLEAPQRYVAAAPLIIAAGRAPEAIVTVSLSADGAAQSSSQTLGWLLTIAGLIVALAALASLVIGGIIVKPLVQLTAAADGIRRGDLATPIASPTASATREIDTLSATLEQMRHEIQATTAELRRQRGEAEIILAGIDDGVLVVDAERRLTYLNARAASLIQLDAASAIGRFCGDVLHPAAPADRPCATHCPIVRARAIGGTSAHEQIRRDDGRSRVVVVTSAPPEHGRQVVVLRDETERESVRRARDAILANISHEFRTPLSAQQASIELLLERLPELTTEQVGQLVLSLQRGTTRLTQLIDNLLESVRIDAGSEQIRRAPVALDDVIEAAAEMIRPLLSRSRQAIVVDLPYPLPLIVGDAPRLTQVFVNLLANANKFAPSGTTVRIGGVLHDETIVLWVWNQGARDAVEVGPSLFDRFVRGDGQEPAEQGSGLGLWIVKSIVERHGGRVGARAVPDGTQLYLVLPREQEIADEDPRRR